MTSRRLGRRQLLKSLGIGAGMLPLLDMSRSFGAAADYPKRLVIVMWTNGTIPSAFWPTGSPGALTSSMLPAITAPLAPHTGDLLFIQNLETRNFTDLDDIGTFGHQTYATTFTGTRGNVMRGGSEPRVYAVSPSIDQVIADGIGENVTLPLRSLNLSVLCGGNQDYNCCFYREQGNPVAAEEDPVAAANKLFMGMPDLALARIRAERRSMLDFAGGTLSRFARNLGTDDRRKLEAHLDSVRELDRQISALGDTTCAGPALSPIEQTIPNYPAIMNSQMDVLVAALKCDLTRVATLQLGNFNGDGVIFSWIGLDGQAVGTDFGPGKLRDWHDVAHTPRDPDNPTAGNEEHKIKLDTWMLQQFAALIQRFKDVPEGDGNMLDNTAILFANHMTNGSRHNWDNLPWFIAGGCGGALGTGRLLRAAESTPSNQLFAGLAQAMDVDLPNGSFGDPDYAGILPGLAG